MTLGAMNHLALTRSDLKGAETRLYKPVLEFLGYRKVEDEDGMTVWLSGATFAAVNLWQAAPDLAGLSPAAPAPPCPRR